MTLIALASEDIMAGSILLHYSNVFQIVLTKMKGEFIVIMRGHYPHLELIFSKFMDYFVENISAHIKIVAPILVIVLDENNLVNHLCEISMLSYGFTVSFLTDRHILNDIETQFLHRVHRKLR